MEGRISMRTEKTIRIRKKSKQRRVNREEGQPGNLAAFVEEGV